MPSPFFSVRSAARSRLPDKTLGKVSASLPKHPQHSTSEHAHIHTHVDTFCRVENNWVESMQNSRLINRIILKWKREKSSRTKG